MADRKKIFSVKFFLAGLWLVFTLSFAIWWMILGLRQIDQIQALLHESTQWINDQRRMMLWEGVAWALLLVAGGVWLIWLLLREEQRGRLLKEFFATFSHDIKTAITSLRLQAESLKEDFEGREHPALERLVADTVRLQIQLENSLFLSQSQDYTLYKENLSLRQLLASIQYQWPNIEVKLENDAVVVVDERAMKTALSNIIHNAVVHGEAKRIEFSVKRQGAGRIQILFQDNGKGFQGDKEQLGRLFLRLSSTSGSGVGVYVAKDLIRRMEGQLEFQDSEVGFAGQIILPGNPL